MLLCALFLNSLSYLTIVLYYLPILLLIGSVVCGGTLYIVYLFRLVVYRLLLAWCCVCLVYWCLLLLQSVLYIGLSVYVVLVCLCWLLSQSMLYIGYLCTWLLVLSCYSLYAVYFVPAGLLVSYLVTLPLISIYRFISLLFVFIRSLGVLLVSYTIKHLWRVLISLYLYYWVGVYILSFPCLVSIKYEKKDNGYYIRYPLII